MASATLPPGSPRGHATPVTVHDIFLELLFETLGVMAAAFVADSGPRIGNTVVMLMLGFALVWFMLHFQLFGALIGKGSRA